MVRIRGPRSREWVIRDQALPGKEKRPHHFSPGSVARLPASAEPLMKSPTPVFDRLPWTSMEPVLFSDAKFREYFAE